MARVELTAHLRDLFPTLGADTLVIDADTVSDLVAALEIRQPGLAFYLCDEAGRLRRHVNIFVNGEMIIDRPQLSDRLTPASAVFVAQALSGG